jgi:tetratricopeptide (TPR) repeat protein
MAIRVAAAPGAIEPTRVLNAFARRVARVVGSAPSTEQAAERRYQRARYHLGRGRRARDRGRFDTGAREARQALRHDPASAWAHALLGQCLLRQRCVDLAAAQQALERACALSPTNGYFVRLLLQVLEVQGDPRARDLAVAKAWWAGAPVERWMRPTERVKREPAHRAVETAEVGSERRDETVERTRGGARVGSLSNSSWYGTSR